MESIALWKALACFGRQQVDKVLRNPQWRSVYPDLFDALDRARYDAMIPPALLHDMARTEPHLYIFAFREDELICRDRIERVPKDFKLLSPLEALNRFGGDQMLEAVDYGTNKVTNT